MKSGEQGRTQQSCDSLCALCVPAALTQVDHPPFTSPVHAAFRQDPADAIASTLGSLRELDASHTMLERWDQIAVLGSALPNLHTLDLSHTHGLGHAFACGATSRMPLAASLRGLHTLALNDCGVSWSAAVAVAGTLEALTELRLSGNSIVQLSSADDAALREDAGARTPPSTRVSRHEGADTVRQCAELRAPSRPFPALRLLDLQNNALSDWEDVSSTLGTLATLRTLLLGANRLSHVRVAQGTFPELRALQLSNNAVGAWQEVSELAGLPRLQDLRLAGNALPLPVTGDERIEVRSRLDHGT